MRLSLYSAMLALSLVTASTVWAEPVNDVDLTGREWNLSSRDEKLAFLYGASSIVAIENMLAERAGKEPSPFVRGWIRAFGTSSWVEMEKKLDSWYARHPKDSDRHVLDVMWSEFLKPGLNQPANAGGRP